MESYEAKYFTLRHFHVNFQAFRFKTEIPAVDTYIFALKSPPNIKLLGPNFEMKFILKFYNQIIWISEGLKIAKNVKIDLWIFFHLMLPTNPNAIDLIFLI